MSNLVGGMPHPRGSYAAVDWKKFPWLDIADLAQANPGVPTCHESLQDVEKQGYIAESIKNANIAAHGGDLKKGKAPMDIVEVLIAAGGHFTAWSRTTTVRGTKPTRGNVWLQWDPDRAGV